MRNAKYFGLAAAVMLTSVSCSSAIRQGGSPVILVINSLLAAPGGGHGANTFVGSLQSDVQVLITSPAPCAPATPCPTVFNDSGQVTLQLVPKDSTIAPTTNNQVTISGYHVDFVRSDGHNTQGVDVPYSFDGTMTGTVPPTGSGQFTFELVRHTSKEETPLVQLIVNPTIISTQARITFYGKDLTGNAIQVTGSITVDFGNFGDQ
jgi:hypothetical protein